MTTAIFTPIDRIELMPGSAIWISGIDRAGYLNICQQLGEDRATRIAYDRRILEIRMPSQLHESINRLLAAIVMTLAEEFGHEFNNLGSMTIDRPTLEKAIEPDSCFYIQNAHGGQGMEQIIANSDLPPDLAIEVDIANRSDRKLHIYRAIGVPEVWLYQSGGTLKIKQLANDHYIDVLHSLAFPALTTANLIEWIELRRTSTDLTVIRAVRAFCRALEFND
jgi:Uma2 family endonuclease